MTRSVTESIVGYFLETSNKIYSHEREVLDKKEFKDLTLLEVRLVAQISRLKKPTMTLIAKNLNLTLSSVTIAVASLEKKKCIVRKKSKVDKRIIYPCLTKRGKEVADTYFRFFNDLILFCNKNMQKDEVHAIYKWLTLMNEFVPREGVEE